MNKDLISCVDEIIESERQTLKRIGDHTVELTNYLKHDGGSGTKMTGKALL